MGSTTNVAANRTFKATAVAIAANALVALDSSGTISVAGDNATDHVIGSTTEPVAASDFGNVRFLNTGGTIELIAGGDTVAVDAIVYTDGSGKIGTDATNVKIGYALQASSTDGDVIEVLIHNHVFA